MLALGTMNWGTTAIDRYLNGGSCLDEGELVEIAKAAAARGVVRLDTAEGYGGGTSESVLSRVLTRAKLADRAIVATKFIPLLHRWTEGSFRGALDASLARLAPLTLDVHFLHTPVHPLPLEHWVRHACKAQAAGKFRRLGLSNCNAAQLERGIAEAARHGTRVEVLQISFNLLTFNSPEIQRVLATCKRENVEIWAYAPVGQSLLCDGLTEEKFAKVPLRRMALIGWDELQPLRAVVAAVAKAHNATMAQVALAFVRQCGAVPLVGAKRLSQTRENLDSLAVELTPGDMRRLKKAALSLSTLSKPKWRRVLFVVGITVLMLAYRVCILLEF